MQRELSAAQTRMPEQRDADARESRRRVKSRLQECFREGDEFCVRKSWRGMAVWRRDADSPQLRALLQDPDDWVRRGALLTGGMMPTDNTASVVHIQVDARAVVIKRRNRKPGWHGIRRLLRPSHARVNWRAAHLLLCAGINTPQPIAFIERRFGPFTLHGYYVSAFCDAPSAAEKYAAQPPTAHELEYFARLFARLHRAGIRHGDCHASNLLVGDDDILLVDLDSTRQCGARMRAHAHAKNRARFLRSWRGDARLLEMFTRALDDDDNAIRRACSS